MGPLICLDRVHFLPLAFAGADNLPAALLAQGRCPACPDTELGTPTRTGVQVCPCCWSAWWTEGDAVGCTPGAVVVEEPAAPSSGRRRTPA